MRHSKTAGEDKLLVKVYCKFGWKIDSFLPLVRLKHEETFMWGDEQRQVFVRINECLDSPPVLRAPRTGKEIKLYIAAHDRVIGAVLTQEDGGKEFSITYLSQRLSDMEGRYTFIEKLCYYYITHALSYIITC
jgi:hypothetical protein